MNYVLSFAAASLFLVMAAFTANAEPKSDKSFFLLPSQDTPNFYNAKMCRDHQVLSALLTAAKGLLKTKVTIAGSSGPTTPADSDDIRLEAVSVLSDDKGAIFCSATISAKRITETVVYSVGPT